MKYLLAFIFFGVSVSSYAASTGNSECDSTLRAAVNSAVEGDASTLNEIQINSSVVTDSVDRGMFYEIHYRVKFSNAWIQGTAEMVSTAGSCRLYGLAIQDVPAG